MAQLILQSLDYQCKQIHIDFINLYFDTILYKLNETFKLRIFEIYT